MRRNDAIRRSGCCQSFTLSSVARPSFATSKSRITRRANSLSASRRAEPLPPVIVAVWFPSGALSKSLDLNSREWDGPVASVSYRQCILSAASLCTSAVFGSKRCSVARQIPR